MKLWMRGLFLAATLVASGVSAADCARAGDGVVELNDFRFADGEQLERLKLHYRTLGAPRRDDAGRVINAVLLLHGTTGTADTMLAEPFRQALYGPGKPLDAERFFVVIPDGIGAGGSSKPSDGLHARFPHYGCKDQVRAHRELLQAIGVSHVKLVLGTSMGGMQTILWGEMFPQDADALVAIACSSAAIAGRNMMWRSMIIEAIRTDPDWNGGDYKADKPPRAWTRTALPLFGIMTESAQQLQRKAPNRAEAADLVHKMANRAAKLDANDFLYTFDSSADYDPTSRLAAITKPTLMINFNDDLLNPPELLRLPERANFTKVMLPGGYGHQTLAHPDMWAPRLAAFLAEIPGWQ